MIPMNVNPDKVCLAWEKEFKCNVASFFRGGWKSVLTKLPETELIALIKRVAKRYHNGQIEGTVEAYFLGAVDTEVDRASKPANKLYVVDDIGDLPTAADPVNSIPPHNFRSDNLVSSLAQTIMRAVGQPCDHNSKVKEIRRLRKLASQIWPDLRGLRLKSFTKEECTELYRLRVSSYRGINA